MQKKTLIIGGSVLAAALVFGGVGVAVGAALDSDDDMTTSSAVDRDDRTGDDRTDDDRTTEAAPTAAAVSDADISSATAAALDATEDGDVTEVERSTDPDHAWDVEVTFADGHDVEVELDEDFGLVRIDD